MDDDQQAWYFKLKEEVSQIATAKDLDYLLAKLKGDSSELFKAVDEEEEKIEEELDGTPVKKEEIALI